MFILNKISPAKIPTKSKKWKMVKKRLQKPKSFLLKFIEAQDVIVLKEERFLFIDPNIASL